MRKPMRTFYRLMESFDETKNTHSSVFCIFCPAVFTLSPPYSTPSPT